MILFALSAILILTFTFRRQQTSTIESWCFCAKAVLSGITLLEIILVVAAAMTKISHIDAQGYVAEMFIFCARYVAPFILSATLFWLAAEFKMKKYTKPTPTL